jgi:TRAP-type C4-dicarboxylate transport system permease small subunit
MGFASRLRDGLTRLTAALTQGLAAAGVLCVVAMMVIVTYDVIARYVFNDPTTWAGEIASYLMIAIVFFGLAFNLRQGSHIRIDVLTNLAPARARQVLEVAAYAVGVVFSVLLLMGTWSRFENFWVRQTTSDSPLMTALWIPMVPVLLGAAILSLAMVAGFASTLHALLAGESTAFEGEG